MAIAHGASMVGAWLRVLALFTLFVSSHYLALLYGMLSTLHGALFCLACLYVLPCFTSHCLVRLSMVPCFDLAIPGVSPPGYSSWLLLGVSSWLLYLSPICIPIVILYLSTVYLYCIYSVYPPYPYATRYRALLGLVSYKSLVLILIHLTPNLVL